jgi:UDP-N-acetylmuramate--alanine ligase
MTGAQKTINNEIAADVETMKFHFIGAGGIGMSGLAKLLIKNNAIVTGSDQTPSAVTDTLCQIGADIKAGHHPTNLPTEIDAVVISAAIKDDNPELKLARQRNCKIYKYAQMLGKLCNRYDCIAVAGTHGKSTTSAWLTWALKHTGADPNFIIGAYIIQLGTSSGTGGSNYFVAEACEYDRSFLSIKPKIACLLNIEADHLDYYKDQQDIIDAFTDFALGTKSGGVVIANGQDKNVAEVIQKLPPDIKCSTFGFDRNCDFYPENIRLIDGLYAFEVYQNDRLLGEIQITLPGKHNILNALAVITAAANTNLDINNILRAIPLFIGIDRRLMLKEKIGQITVLDDYAHHPTEIKASLQAIRQKYNPKRIWCVFQPHQYSRTRFLLDDFAESFKLADVTIVPEIYFVRDSEKEKKEINSEILVDKIRANGSDALFIEGFNEICEHLKNNVTAGDLVVTMGAGDIWKVADEYIHWLGKNR